MPFLRLIKCETVLLGALTSSMERRANNGIGRFDDFLFVNVVVSIGVLILNL